MDIEGLITNKKPLKNKKNLNILDPYQDIITLNPLQILKLSGEYDILDIQSVK